MSKDHAENPVRRRRCFLRGTSNKNFFGPDADKMSFDGPTSESPFPALRQRGKRPPTIPRYQINLPNTIISYLGWKVNDNLKLDVHKHGSEFTIKIVKENGKVNYYE